MKSMKPMKSMKSTNINNILDNNMKIDIKDERFKIERCGKHYDDYSHWNEIRDEAIVYRL